MVVFVSFDVGMMSIAYCIAEFVEPDTADEKEEDCFNRIPIIKSFKVDNISGGKANTEIHTVERIARTVNFLKRVVEPDMRNRVEQGKEIKILVENQMGPNTAARTVMTTIITRFVERYRVIIIGPSLKNKISLAPGLEHQIYVDKYKTLSSANKSHTVDNFLFALKHANQSGQKMEKSSITEHVADAYCQIVGYIWFGCKEDAF